MASVTMAVNTIGVAAVAAKSTKLEGASLDDVIKAHDWRIDQELTDKLGFQIFVDSSNRILSISSYPLKIGHLYPDRADFVQLMEKVQAVEGQTSLLLLADLTQAKFALAWKLVNDELGDASRSEMSAFVEKARRLAVSSENDKGVSFVILTYTLGEIIRATEPDWEWCFEYNNGNIARLSLCKWTLWIEVWNLSLKRLKKFVTNPNQFNFIEFAAYVRKFATEKPAGSTEALQDKYFITHPDP
jgi:hypothetical protein